MAIRRKPNNRNFRRPVKEEPYRVNEKIRGVREVRVVGENVETGVYSVPEALNIAKDMGLDLVEISPKANPPVCKVIDYSKFKYEQKKKQKELKSKQHKVVQKEIRFGPNTDDHDFEFKTKHAETFLKEGNKVKAYVQFYGRSIVYKDRGFELLDKFSKALEEHAKVETPPKMEGRRMNMILAPIKSGTAKS